MTIIITVQCDISGCPEKSQLADPSEFYYEGFNCDGKQHFCDSCWKQIQEDEKELAGV